MNETNCVEYPYTNEWAYSLFEIYIYINIA